MLLKRCFFFIDHTGTTDIYTLSLHDALPISRQTAVPGSPCVRTADLACPRRGQLCRSEEHTSELQSHSDLVCRLLLEKKKSSTMGLHSIVLAGWSRISSQ